MSIQEISDGDTAAKTVCHCPAVVETGGGRTQVMFQGLWYVDDLVRTADGWRIRKRVETDYYAHNVPLGFRFD